MSKQAITITIELSSVDPIREDLVNAIQNYLTNRDDGRGPTESEIIVMMLERAVNCASRTLINHDMFNLYGHEMVDVGPRRRTAKWLLESEKIMTPEIWINPWSIISVDWTDKT